MNDTRRCKVYKLTMKFVAWDEGSIQLNLLAMLVPFQILGDSSDVKRLSVELSA